MGKYVNVKRLPFEQLLEKNMDMLVKLNDTESTNRNNTHQHNVVQGSKLADLNIVLTTSNVSCVLATSIQYGETKHHEVVYPDNEHFVNGRSLSHDISLEKTFFSKLLINQRPE